MNAPQRLVPRAEDAPDGVTWNPLDDPGVQVLAYRPGEELNEGLPIYLRLGRVPARLFLLTREDARRLADALEQADEVAGGAA